MANIIKRNLDNLFDDPFRGVDDLFKGFFVRPVEYQRGPRMSVDVKEDDKAYTVHADLPGVKKEDIDVQIEGNAVRISAESRQEKEEKEGEKVIRSERYIGHISRSFTLANEVDEENATAKFENGVLELTLPKKEMPVQGRKLLVE